MTISQNISKIGQHEFSSSTWFRATCTCSNEDHDLTMEVSREKDLDPKFPEVDPPEEVNLCIYANACSAGCWGSYRENWFKMIWWRIKEAVKLVFKGYHQTQTTFTMRGEKQVQDFINALQEGLEYAKKEKPETVANK